ncbi:MAG TPA: VCBS repeat-containing protein [Polyangiaceae bacterium]|nr:VCBS repeat-containing protein [Polyangiaceae bacterium]
MSLNWRIALGALWLGCCACTEFPTIPENVCGNHVIDRDHEDCDTFGLFPGSKCREPGMENECRYECSLDDKGKQYLCPAGWGCDQESICRPPSNQFVETALWSDVGAWTLNAGDFDGDGREDVMSSEPLDATGATRLRFNYFDAQGALSETRLFPKSVRSPTINQISGDANSDIAFTTEALGLMYGRRDRSWVPEVFSSYRRANASVRLVGVYDDYVERSYSFTNLLTTVAGTGFYLGNSETGKLELRLGVSGSIDELAGDLVSGNVFEDEKHSPCLEPVFAMRGAQHFNVVDTCDTGTTGNVVWRAQFLLREIALDPPAAIDVAPQLVDLNNDDHLDVLLGADGQPYVSYGDGVKLSVATPYTDHAQDPAFPPGTPLAVADFSGDRAPDFVYPDRLVVSTTAYDGAVPVYQEIGNSRTTPWTVAKIADFNGNKLPDVVAASTGSLNLDFFNGTNSVNLAPFVVSTSAPVQFLSAGDVDGDLITDLALFEVPPAHETVSKLKVAFGNAFAPLATPLAVGQIDGVESLGSYRNGGMDNLAVCSSDNVGEARNGALTLLSGGPDRLPFAPLSLTEFSSNGSVEDAVALAVVSGQFSGEGQTDLVALGSFDLSPTPPPIDFWWVPAIAAQGATPSRLPIKLDPRLTPVTFWVDTRTVSADVASTAADFDGVAGDEAIFAMPADGGSHCGVLLIGTRPGGMFGSDVRKPVIINEPCADPQISALKFSEHPELAQRRGADLALLTGRSNADDRHLYVLFNDGQGGFSSQDTVRVSGEDSPQAFTVLPVQQGNAGLAYITKAALNVVHRASAREFSAPDTVPGGVTVNNGTGIVAADVNGDHLSDLVFSEAGTLRVLKAGLVP